MGFLAAQTSTDFQDFLLDLKTHMVSASGGTWTQNEYNTSVGGDSNVDEWIGYGDGAGSDEIHIGMRTFHDSSANIYNIELAGGTGYDSGGSAFGDKLVGISPGRWDESTATLRSGAYLPISVAFTKTVTWWASSTARRIYGVCKIDTSYLSFYMGWLNPYATGGEYNYPLLIAGVTSIWDTAYTSTRAGMGSIVNPQVVQLGSPEENGPMMLRNPGGTWVNIQNAKEGNGNSRARLQERVVWPCGKIDSSTVLLPTKADRWFDQSQDFNDVIPQDNVPGLQTAQLYKTDDSGGDLVKLFPATVVCKPDANTSLLAGELDGCFWLSASPGKTDGSLSAEDTVTIGGDTYYVFPAPNRTNPWDFFAIKAA